MKPQRKNKLIVPIGGKGGVAKTTSVVSLADYLTQSEQPFIALDADGENRGKTTSFAHAVKNAELIKLHKMESMDRLLQGAAESGLVLADLPANASHDFIPWFDSVIEPEILEDLDLSIIGIGCITPKPGTFASVAEWAGKLQDKMNYILVLNRAEALAEESNEEAFPELYSTKAGTAFRSALSPAIVTLPFLSTGAIQLMAKVGGLPTDVAKSTEGLFTDRVRLRKWAQQMHKQWQEVF